MSAEALQFAIEIVDTGDENFCDIIIYEENPRNLKNDSYVKLVISQLEIDSAISFGSENIIKIDRSIADESFLYDGMIVNVVVKGNKFHIGPIVGVFTTPLAVELARYQRASLRMRYLAEANRVAGTILYFFSVKDLKVRENRILGTYYNNRTSLWEQKLFPLPEVLYDRVGELDSSEEQVRKIIRENNAITKLNPMYLFDKWEVHEKLKEYKGIEKYLPYTLMYNGPQDLLNMFEKYSILYIKDRAGNRGLGVARVMKNPNGVYELSCFTGELHTFYFYSFGRLVNKIDMLFRNKSLIVQWAIDTIMQRESKVDMRATLQRNHKGELEITAYPVRIGREGFPITSTATGSRVEMFEDFFKEQLNYSSVQIEGLKKRIDRFLLDITNCIEEMYGTFGELGIDFALDREGRLWFIECNAKPGKDTIFMSCGEEVIKRSFLNPLEYAKYIYELKK